MQEIKAHDESSKEFLELVACTSITYSMVIRTIRLLNDLGIKKNSEMYRCVSKIYDYLVRLKSEGDDYVCDEKYGIDDTFNDKKGYCFYPSEQFQTTIINPIVECAINDYVSSLETVIDKTNKKGEKDIFFERLIPFLIQFFENDYTGDFLGVDVRFQETKEKESSQTSFELERIEEEDLENE